MAWEAGDPVPNPTAGEVLVQVVFTHGRPLYSVVAISSKVGLDTILRLIAADGVTVKHSIILPVTGSLWVSPRLGPIQVGPNERLQVISRNAVTGAEVQASLFYDT